MGFPSFLTLYRLDLTGEVETLSGTRKKPKEPFVSPETHVGVPSFTCQDGDLVVRTEI